MTAGKLRLKNDRFRKVRGGYSRLLEIYCFNCNNFIVLYQKDGSGSLKRLYKDRIFTTIKNQKKLFCSKCRALVATSTIYQKEKRPAYLLVENSITKKVKKIHS